MEILLRADIAKLGRRGEIVKVSTGYGRNYLIPHGLAVKVEAGNVAQIEQEKRRIAVQDQRRVDDLKGIADRLGAVSVTIQANVNEEGHLFGSVTETHIVEALKSEGFEIAESMVHMESHLKELGMFEIPVVLDESVEAKVKVWVVAQ